MSLPLVSCLCLTYNRAPHYLHLVEEAVESFLWQDYPNRELLILNDTPGQKLHYGLGDNVVVANIDYRFASLGLKYNYALGLARGSLCMLWDDDDICLPNHISRSVQKLGSRIYFNPQHEFYVDPKGTLHTDHSQGVCHHASIFSTEAMRSIGGYDERVEMSGAEDMLADEALKKLGRTAPPLSNDPKTWTYIYRFGVSPTHVSAPAPGRGAEKYLEFGRRPIQEGTFQLRSHWERGYVHLVKDHLQNLS